MDRARRRLLLRGARPPGRRTGRVARAEVRTFRLDRIEAVRILAGAFEVPAGFDPAARVVSGIAEASYEHAVSVLVRGTADEIRRGLPAGIATVRELGSGPAGAEDTRARVQMQVERLDWVPSVLAGLNRQFVVEYPDALREHVRALSRRLAACAEAVADGTADAAAS